MCCLSVSDEHIFFYLICTNYVVMPSLGCTRGRSQLKKKKIYKWQCNFIVDTYFSLFIFQMLRIVCVYFDSEDYRLSHTHIQFVDCYTYGWFGWFGWSDGSRLCMRIKRRLPRHWRMHTASVISCQWKCTKFFICCDACLFFLPRIFFYFYICSVRKERVCDQRHLYRNWKSIAFFVLLFASNIWAKQSDYQTAERIRRFSFVSKFAICYNNNFTITIQCDEILSFLVLRKRWNTLLIDWISKNGLNAGNMCNKRIFHSMLFGIWHLDLDQKQVMIIFRRCGNLCVGWRKFNALFCFFLSLPIHWSMKFNPTWQKYPKRQLYTHKHLNTK